MSPSHPAAIAVANEYSPIEVDAQGVRTPAEWLYVPFGQHPCLGGDGLQLVTAETAAAVANELNAAARSPLFRGRPVFIGHPDDPAFRDRYTDTRAYARVMAAELDVANERLGFRVRWTRKGAAMVADEEFATHSVRWDVALAAPGDAAAIPLRLKPTRLKSIGLTNIPQIEGSSPVANEAPLTAEQDTPNKENAGMELKQRLVALIGKDDVQGEDDIVSFVGKMIDALKAMRESIKDRWKAEDTAYEVANEAAGLRTALDGLLGKLDARMQAAVSNEIDGVTLSAEAKALVEAARADMAVSNERLATLAGHLVDQAMVTGRIAPADKEAWAARLRTGADVAAVANELGAIAPGSAMPVESAAAGRESTRLHAADPRRTVLAARIRAKALAISNEQPCLSWQQCWDQAQGTLAG